MKYRAKEAGFIGGVRIREGQVFEHQGKPGKWMEPVNDTPAPAVEVAPAAQSSRSKRSKNTDDLPPDSVGKVATE